MVRECAREAMKSKLFESESKKEILEFIKNKFPNHYNFVLNNKVILENSKQKRLGEFM